jgi:hypothetical protein
MSSFYIPVRLFYFCSKTFPVLYLICVVWEVDLVEDLSCLVLYGLHLHLVRRVLTLPMPENTNNKPVSNNNNKSTPDPDFLKVGRE